VVFAPRQPPAVSPDGSYLAAVATDAGGNRRLWLLSLAGSAAAPIEGTDGASFPFWSPDGAHLAFFADEGLHRINRAGGGRQTLAGAVDPHGGSWGAGGTIVFSAGADPSIFGVPSDGGAVRQLTNLGPHPIATDAWPAFLPDGQHFLYLSIVGTEEGRILLGSLHSADRDEVMEISSPAAYIDAGALLFARGGALFAYPFDLNVFQRYGRASIIAHPIARGPYGLAPFAASADGSVVVYIEAGGEAALKGLRSCGTGNAATRFPASR
jgi:Tol biopolymer transport system component